MELDCPHGIWIEVDRGLHDGISDRAHRGCYRVPPANWLAHRPIDRHQAIDQSVVLNLVGSSLFGQLLFDALGKCVANTEQGDANGTWSASYRIGDFVDG